MTYVITDKCVGTKNLGCVATCPVDCIHPTESEQGFRAADQLYIDPIACIDCGACVPECPVDAIFAEHDLPEDSEAAVEANAAWFNQVS